MSNKSNEKKPKKTVKINNRSDKPDNVVEKEFLIQKECEDIEKTLPSFMRGFFAYMRSSLLPMSRLAYLHDIKFFCNYLVNHTDLTAADNIKNIKAEEFDAIKGGDINVFIDYCRNYNVETEDTIQVYTNNNRTLSRKKSSISVLFKYLYREEIVSKNITDQFDPIRVQSQSEHEIKALQDDEVMIMLDAVSTGEHLTKKERQFWEKTKKRDKLILVLFLTYGLRLSELHQLNVSSFNFPRGEFKIYRKRGKESIMPLNNKTVLKALHEYIDGERLAEEKIQPGNEDALFLSLQGKRMTERQIRELVKKYTSIGMSTSRKAGYSPHKLRATAATSLIGRGNSIFDVQELLDHENVSTTQLYAAHRLNTKRDLIGSFEWDDEFDDVRK
ncbi:MAG: tyrosine-type recombinase/integrase [Firmicutes bacterium]|nr:tyrosine-type recombinase/integrase [Bacillota bacterium]